MTTVYVGLGSNVNAPLQQLNAAREALAQLADTHILCCSSYYRTKPLGPTNQPDFLNAVIALQTQQSPLDLLFALQDIERAQQRQRLRRWGPRSVDLDILLYGDLILASEYLTLPHPGIAQREFVLYPLLEIAADLVLPTGQSVGQLAQQCYGVIDKIEEPSQC